MYKLQQGKYGSLCKSPERKTPTYFNPVTKIAALFQYCCNPIHTNFNIVIEKKKGKYCFFRIELPQKESKLHFSFSKAFNYIRTRKKHFSYDRYASGVINH